MANVLALLLPTLFPSWRFFDQIGPSPRIEIREPGGEWRALSALPFRVSPWQIVVRLFHSPGWNAHLYRVSTAIHLCVDPSGHALSELTGLIARELPETERFQFRICYLAREDGQIGKFVEYESAEITVPGA